MSEIDPLPGDGSYDDKERLKFEAAARELYPLDKNELGDYVVAVTGAAWWGWLTRAEDERARYGG